MVIILFKQLIKLKLALDFGYRYPYIQRHTHIGGRITVQFNLIGYEKTKNTILEWSETT